MLKEICEFINEKESSHDIMYCYEEYLDGAMDRDVLISICQRVLDDAREDLQVYPEYKKYSEWLGI